MLFYRVAPVAQRIEQLPSKQLVTGSIPVRGTKINLRFFCYSRTVIK